MKQCPICGSWFEPRVYTQTYDKLNCRSKAERQRAQLRDKGVEIEQRAGTSEIKRAVVPMSIEATSETLNEMAQRYVRTPTSPPVYWLNVPTGLEWTPPPEIIFSPQEGFDGWLMCNINYQWPKVEKPVDAAANVPRRSAFDILNASLKPKTP